MIGDEHICIKFKKRKNHDEFNCGKIGEANKCILILFKTAGH